MIILENNRTALYQWDLNQRVALVDIDAGIQVHFSHNVDTEDVCPVVLTYEENGKMYANIPNYLLQKNGFVTVYIYIKSENEAHTEYHAEFPVIARKKPSDYIYTETEVFTWESKADKDKVYSKKEMDKFLKDKSDINHSHLLAGSYLEYYKINLNETDYVITGAEDEVEIGKDYFHSAGANIFVNISGKIKLACSSDNGGGFIIDDYVYYSEGPENIVSFEGEVKDGIEFFTNWGSTYIHTFEKEEEISRDGFMSVADKEKLDNTYTKKEVDNIIKSAILDSWEEAI